MSDQLEQHCPDRGLRERGMRLAVDDPGPDHVSPRHILRPRPDIDLVRGIHADPARGAPTSALRGFGAKIIAIAIEAAHELATLRGLGVRYGQGYHLARPLIYCRRP